MLIGLISDTHIPQRAKKIPENVINAFKDVDLILHAGDLTSYEIINELEDMAPVIAVQGNMDKVAGIDLPPAEIIEIDNIKIGLSHGLVYPKGDSEQLYLMAKEMDVSILITGHTHQPKIETIRDKLLINPGSPTQPRLSDATVMLLNIDNGNVDVELIKVGGPICSALNIDQFIKKENKNE